MSCPRCTHALARRSWPGRAGGWWYCLLAAGGCGFGQREPEAREPVQLAMELKAG